MAALEGQLEVVKALASFGADVNIATNDGVTPLHVAEQQGQLEVVEALVALGAEK
jgi:ankyrin repeat protein